MVAVALATQRGWLTQRRAGRRRGGGQRWCTREGVSAERSKEEENAGGFPWVVVAGASGIGVVDTGYLLAAKLLDAPLACSATQGSGCGDILNSSYGNFLSIPLPLLGLGAYAMTFALATRGFMLSRNGRIADTERSLLLTASGVLGGTSTYLTLLLATRFDGSCPYCITSACLSFTILITCLIADTKRARQPALAAASAVLALSLGYGDLQEAVGLATPIDIPFSAPVVSTPSSERAVRLAKRLRESGSRMYGAFWCSHCAEQKQAFGMEAMKDFPYVECFPNGYRKGVTAARACLEAGVKGYPAWEVKGTLLEAGEKTFDELEAVLDSDAKS